jgi:DNA repair protein RadC
MTTKRREMNERRVERVLDTGTSALSTNKAIRILLALVMIGECTL